MPYILKSEFLKAKFSYLQKFLDSYIDDISTDQDGYIQHPLTAQVGIDPNIRLSSVIASFILGIEEFVEGELNPAISSWYNSRDEASHIWNPINV
jgi:hypothetical protein